MNNRALLERITSDPNIFGGKAIIRGRRLAVEHVLGMMVSGHANDSILEDFPWLEPEDLQACLLYAQCLFANERVEPVPVDSAA